MPDNTTTYPSGHWIRDASPETALKKYMEQQGLAYSRVKNAFVRELLGDLENRSFLDYGCGGGFFSIYAARKKARLVIGVDAEENILSAARLFAARQGVDSGIGFLRAARFPSLKHDVKFDTVLMKDVIEHAPDDSALLAAAAKAMSPGGSLILTTQNSLSMNYLIEGSWNRYVRKNRDWRGWDPTHLRFYNPETLERLLTEAGFSPLQWRAVYLVPYKWPAPWFMKKTYIRINVLSHLDRLLGAVFPFNRLGWNLAVKSVYKG